MADYSISYGEWESQPVFDITAKCGHSFRVYRVPRTPTATIEGILRTYGEQEQCPDCLQGGLQAILDEADYRLNPDTAARGWDRILSATSEEITPIDVAGDDDGDDDDDDDILEQV